MARELALLLSSRQVLLLIAKGAAIIRIVFIGSGDWELRDLALAEFSIREFNIGQSSFGRLWMNYLET